MGPFVVEFYETRDGQRPAEDFLDELDIKMRSKLVMTLKVLQEQGNRLREPYSKHLDDGIFAKKIDMSNAGPYDQGLNESFQTAFKDYFTGTVDEDTAKANFETAIKEKYPELTDVVWPA